MTRADTGDEYLGPAILSAVQPDIFAHLTETEIGEIKQRGRNQVFEKGETLFRQGDHHKGIFLILSGLVKTCYLTPSGRELTLGYWKGGNVCGTPEVLGTSRKMWSGFAVYSTEALVLPVEELRKAMQDHPGFAIGMVEALEYKAQCISEMLQLLGTCSVPARIKHVLRILAEKYGVREEEGIRLERPFTHAAIAEMTGASRQWVTVTVDRLQEEGLVHMEGRKLIILQEPSKISP